MELFFPLAAKQDNLTPDLPSAPTHHGVSTIEGSSRSGPGPSGKRPNYVEESDSDSDEYEPLPRRRRLRSPETSPGNGGLFVGYLDGNLSFPVYSKICIDGKESITHEEIVQLKSSGKINHHVPKAACTRATI